MDQDFSSLQPLAEPEVQSPALPLCNWSPQKLRLQSAGVVCEQTLQVEIERRRQRRKRLEQMGDDSGVPTGPTCQRLTGHREHQEKSYHISGPVESRGVHTAFIINSRRAELRTAAVPDFHTSQGILSREESV
ncbi:unnamed protein product [Pleuronectes platessa]|uniref:Uncharacterized protein n=1 Tax=Pleuronectes platessa TaxID=8262 RepID=A0A9N7VAH9_PLEPL|nr:unnamed protein product [Pleuronectes platessa]